MASVMEPDVIVCTATIYTCTTFSKKGWSACVMFQAIICTSLGKNTCSASLSLCDKLALYVMCYCKHAVRRLSVITTGARMLITTAISNSWSYFLACVLWTCYPAIYWCPIPASISLRWLCIESLLAWSKLFIGDVSFIYQLNLQL